MNVRMCKEFWKEKNLLFFALLHATYMQSFLERSTSNLRIQAAKCRPVFHNWVSLSFYFKSLPPLLHAVSRLLLNVVVQFSISTPICFGGRANFCVPWFNVLVI